MDIRAKAAEDLQKTLQEIFEAQCRCYSGYLRTYKNLLEVCKKLEEQQKELRRKEELTEKVTELNRFLNSSNFDEIKQLVNLTDVDKENFTKAFLDYQSDSTLTENLAGVRYKLDILGRQLNH